LAASTRFTCDYDLSTCIASLQVENALLNDTATYRLVGENEAGADQTAAEAFVVDTANVDESCLLGRGDPLVEERERGKPARFVLQLRQEVRLCEGDGARLECKVEGYPLPKVG
jgi:hypothetical protein